MIFFCACMIGVVALVPWIVFKPSSPLASLHDTLDRAHAQQRYGESCRVYVKDILRESEESQRSIDLISLIESSSVEVTSHIDKEKQRVYRLIRSSSSLGASKDSHEASTVVMETILDRDQQYLRYDTQGTWITFPQKTLSDLNDYIKNIFQDQWYASLDDIEKNSASFQKMQTGEDGESIAVFRGTQTRKSLENARRFFEYPIGTYTIREQYGDIFIDTEKKSVAKTQLVTLFDYQDDQNPPVKLSIPLYQECERVKEKDLAVHPPSDAIFATREQIQQYVLFRIMPQQ